MEEKFLTIRQVNSQVVPGTYTITWETNCESTGELTVLLIALAKRGIDWEMCFDTLERFRNDPRFPGADHYEVG